MEQSTLNIDTGDVSIKRFLFCISIKSAYAYTCCCFLSLAKGLSYLCCLNIYISFQTAIFLMVFHGIQNEEIDIRIMFRCLQVMYGIFAIFALYGIEKDKLVLVKTYYYIKLVELLTTITRYTLMLYYAKCVDDYLLDVLKEFCFTSPDGFIFAISIILIVYEAFLVFSYVNLMILGEAAKVKHDADRSKREPLPSIERSEQKTEVNQHMEVNISETK